MDRTADSHPLPGQGRVRRKVGLLYIVYFLSGVAGLGYQMVWSRLFTTGLGHEMPSVLAVVAAFFGGLALGSWALDGVVSRSARPGHWYVGLEILIGLWGIGSVWLIGGSNDVAMRLIGVEPSAIRHWAVAFLVPLAVLLPATTAMGATFPAMERFVSPLTADGRCVAGLYSANTAGAVAGTLGSAFLVMPWLGFSYTVFLLATLNLACAAMMTAFGLRHEPRPAEPDAAWAPAEIPRSRMVATVFFTGLLGIGYEVLGVRVLSQVLENTIYSFAAILSIYLLGTAIGASLYQRWGRGGKFAPLLGYLVCGLACACMLGVFGLSAARWVYARARNDLFGDTLLGVMASEMAVAAMIFIVPTVLMGAIFSHLVQGLKRSTGGVGRATAVNTLGGSLAPLLFGVVLLPLVGAKWAMVILSLSYLLLIPRVAGVWWAWEAVPVLLVLALPQSLQVITKPADEKVIDYREGVMAAVAVLQDANGYRSLRVNNRFRMGSTDPEGVVFESLQAQTPLLLHPSPKRALFLGLGTAITFHAAAFEPGLRADGVELVPEVVDAITHFKPVNLPAGSGQNLKIYTADARRFVRAGGDRYDVIVADLFHPGHDGAGLLYTTEHFKAVRNRLQPDGLFCQWLPLYQLDEPTLRVIVKTFLQVFPDTRGYLVDFEIGYPALGLVAAMKPTRYPPDWFEKRVRDDQLRRYLKGLLLTSSVRLLGACVADVNQLRSYAGDSPVNTDDRPRVTFDAPKFTSRQNATSYGRLSGLLEHCRGGPVDLIAPVEPGTGADDFHRRLSGFIQARDLYIQGLIAAAQGQPQQAIDTLIQSAGVSADFTTAYARCLAIAREQAKTDRPAARELLARLMEAQPSRDEARRWLEQLPQP